MCAAIPRTSLAARSISPGVDARPDLDSQLLKAIDDRTAQRTARAGPSNVAGKPLATVRSLGLRTGGRRRRRARSTPRRRRTGSRRACAPAARTRRGAGCRTPGRVTHGRVDPRRIDCRSRQRTTVERCPGLGGPLDRRDVGEQHHHLKDTPGRDGGTDGTRRPRGPSSTGPRRSGSGRPDRAPRCGPRRRGSPRRAVCRRG